MLRQRAPVERMTLRALQTGAVFQLHLQHAARCAGWDEFVCALQVHDVHAVAAHWRFHGGGSFGPSVSCTEM